MYMILYICEFYMTVTRNGTATQKALFLIPARPPLFLNLT